MHPCARPGPAAVGVVVVSQSSERRSTGDGREGVGTGAVVVVVVVVVGDCGDCGGCGG